MSSSGSTGRSLAGDSWQLTVGPVAHGGHCVARVPDDVPDVGGVVVFVRHALPGETVTARVTEGRVGDRFVRADAVRVHEASPDRVPAPCPHAGPGRCGGCDFQHADLDAQRRLKAAVVSEQLRRLAGIDREVVVEALPGDVDGLRWRTRMRFQTAPSGRLGLRRHRSHAVEPVDDCLIQAPEAVVVIDEPAPRSRGRQRPMRRPADQGTVVETVGSRAFEVARDGFWQAHRDAPRALVEAVLQAADVGPGDRVADLYSGVGLFAAFLAEAAGSEGRVLAVEGDRRAADLAAANLADLPTVSVACAAVDGDVASMVAERMGEVDVVVVDPPRTGLRAAGVDLVCALAPRRVVYVACDPAALGRDLATFGKAGYDLGSMRAFDLFPMTHHVECVALLTKTGSDLR